MTKMARNNWVTLDMYFNGSIRSEQIALRFFDLFQTVFPAFAFKAMGQWEPLKRKFDLAQGVIEWQTNRSVSSSEFGDYVFHGTDPVSFYVFTRWFGASVQDHWADSISVMLDEKFWFDGRERDPTGCSIRLLKELSTLGNTLYGRGFHSSEFESKDFRERVLKDGTVSRESISLTPREGIVDLFWANYFGKQYVGIFGEEALRRVKCMWNERVGEGYLHVFAQDPLHWNDPETLSSEQSARAELDRGAFLDLSREFRPSLKIQP